MSDRSAETNTSTTARPGPRREPDPGNRPTLLVASTGGHLEQLLRLRDRLTDVAGATEWATFDGPQSRALLRGETVHHVGYIRPRDLTSAAKSVVPALDIIRRGDFGAVVSTGAGIALPFFLAAASQGVARYYIESAARAAGPSLTGRLVSRVPGTRLFTQYRAWEGGRWTYVGSLFDAFEPGGPEMAPLAPGAPARRVVVSLGTMPRYGFRRLVERLVTILPEVCAPDADVLWQTGATDLTELPVAGRNQVSADELQRAIVEADLVVTHGGIGSALTVLEAGRVPVMVPRRAAFGEHVDDHQTLICSHLGERGIAVSREVADLSPADLWEAAHASSRMAVPAPMTLSMVPTNERRRSPRGRHRAAHPA